MVSRNCRGPTRLASVCVILAAAILLYAVQPAHAQQRQQTSHAATATDNQQSTGKAPDSEPATDQPKLPRDIKPDEVAGVVVDAQGRPLAGVLVDAWTWYTGTETTTDENGAFRLTPTDDGRAAEIRFSKPGYSPHYVIQQPSGGPALVVALGNRTYFEGTLRGQDRAPVADATVRGIQGRKQGDGVMIDGVTTTTTTDGQGHYRLYVFPDTYDIQVAVAGTGVARMSGVAVDKDEAKPLDINLQPGVRFEARVVDADSREPVEKLVLYNFRDRSVRGVSDREGRIVIDTMLPGEYTFAVGHGEAQHSRGMTYYRHGDLGRWWSPAAVHEWQRKSVGPDGWQRNLDNLAFDLSVGMEPVTIEVERGAVFSGHVYDPDGKPVAGATVAPAKTGSGNSLTGDTRYSVRTEDDGSYRAVIPAGNGFAYNLVAHDGDYGEWRNWANGVSEPLVTGPGQRISNFDLRLTRGGTIRGRVVANGGRLPAHCEVRASAADLRENRYYDPTVKVNADGSFALPFVRPGKHYVQVSPFWLTAADAPPESSALVEIKADEVREGIELRVAPPVESLRFETGGR